MFFYKKNHSSIGETESIGDLASSRQIMHAEKIGPYSLIVFFFFIVCGFEEHVAK